MTVTEFFDKYNGKAIDFDKYYGAQCMDVWQQFNKEVMSGPHIPSPAAADVWALNNYPTNLYDKVANTPDGVPQKGDVVIWNKKSGGGYGHIAIFNEGDASRFTSMDQNWPSGSICHFQEHTYTNVYGWLRPRNLPQVENPQAIIDELRTARDHNWELYQGQVAETGMVKERVAELESEVSQLRTDKEQLTKDVNSCETQVGQYLDQLAKITDEDKSTSEQLLDAQKALQPFKDELQAIRKALGIFEESSILDAIKELKTSKVKTAKKPVTLYEKLVFLFT